MIPDDLREAAQRSLQRHGALDAIPFRGQPGELSVARVSGKLLTGHVSRVIAVIASDEATRTLVVQLATNEIENATDLDLIVRSREGGVPFAVAIQAELYGPIFSDQLDRGIGKINDRELHAVASALLTDGESLDGLPVGSPLGATDDPRRRFKERELNDLESLTEACRRWLARERSPHAVIDPRLLVPPPAGSPREVAEDQFLELLDAVAALADGPIEIPSEFLAGSDDLLDEILRWRRDFGLDASRVLTRVRITELDSATADDTLKPDEAEPSPLAVTGALHNYLASSARAGRPVVDVQSVRRCWGEHEVVILTRAGARYCRTRAHFVEAA